MAHRRLLARTTLALAAATALGCVNLDKNKGPAGVPHGQAPGMTAQMRDAMGTAAVRAAAAGSASVMPNAMRARASGSISSSSTTRASAIG